MSGESRRKVVLFLVEGKSERAALYYPISALYDRLYSNIVVRFALMVDENGEEVGGDITTTWGVRPKNIEQAIFKRFIRRVIDVHRIYPKDILEIVQLIDTDGAFVPDNLVHRKEDLPEERRTLYKDTEILTVNVEGIIRRNRQKRENMEYLSSRGEIIVQRKRIKYSAYYFSSNLDHFLHGEANLDSREKRAAAHGFSNTYEKDVNGFIDFITGDSGAARGMNYEESWGFIKEEGANSLGRHTNLNVLLEKLCNKGHNVPMI